MSDQPITRAVLDKIEEIEKQLHMFRGLRHLWANQVANHVATLGGGQLDPNLLLTEQVTRLKLALSLARSLLNELTPDDKRATRIINALELYGEGSWRYDDSNPLARFDAAWMFERSRQYYQRDNTLFLHQAMEIAREEFVNSIMGDQTLVDTWIQANRFYLCVSCDKTSVSSSSPGKCDICGRDIKHGSSLNDLLEAKEKGKHDE